jgi:hypothetical protein
MGLEEIKQKYAGNEDFDKTFADISSGLFTKQPKYTINEGYLFTYNSPLFTGNFIT